MFEYEAVEGIFHVLGYAVCVATFVLLMEHLLFFSRRSTLYRWFAFLHLGARSSGLEDVLEVDPRAGSNVGLGGLINPATDNKVSPADLGEITVEV